MRNVDSAKPSVLSFRSRDYLVAVFKISIVLAFFNFVFSRIPVNSTGMRVQAEHIPTDQHSRWGFFPRSGSWVFPDSLPPGAAAGRAQVKRCLLLHCVTASCL